jgi:hypothetical protein
MKCKWLGEYKIANGMSVSRSPARTIFRTSSNCLDLAFAIGRQVVRYNLLVNSTLLRRSMPNQTLFHHLAGLPDHRHAGGAGGRFCLQLGAGACSLAERIRNCIAESPVRINSLEIWLTASIGVATKTEKTPDVLALFKMADEAMYLAKKSGRNRTAMLDDE